MKHWFTRFLIIIVIFAESKRYGKGKKTTREMVGETLLDFSKVTFGGIVIAGIFESGANRIMLVSGAVLFCPALIATGIYLSVTKK